MNAITIHPTNPDYSTPVTITVGWSGCVIDSGFQQTGHTFDIWYNFSSDCFGVPPGGIADFPVGILHPGIYNVTLEYSVDGTLQSSYSTSFSVTPATGASFQVPILGLGATIFLVFALVASAAKFRHKANYSVRDSLLGTTFAFALLALAAATLHAQDMTASSQPSWLKAKIASYEAFPASVPPRSILGVNYEGKPAFYVSPACCDIPSELYDESGKLLCFPAGGFAGGDGRCPTFALPQKPVSLVWRDSRTSQATVRKAAQR